MVQTASRPAISEQRDGYVFRSNLPFELGPGVGQRAKIGMIVLDTDGTMEFETGRILARDGVAVYGTRIPMGTTVTLETLRAMEPAITAAAREILPDEDLDVIAYCCTSGTAAIGKERIFALIHAGRPAVACTTPIVAGVAAARALGIRRLAVLTPYVEEVSLSIRDFIRREGIDVPVLATFNTADDREVRRISAASLREAILEAGRGDVEAVFVSCTSLYVTPAIAECEAALGKPVLASNQAMAWHCLRLAGVNDRVAGFGRLLTV